MEEVVGFATWLDDNKDMLNRKYPFILKTYKNYSTAGIAMCVYEQLTVCIIFCIVALFMKNKIFYGIWLGGVIAYTLHLIVHIMQSIILRQYIPAVATSIICLPISLWLIVTCISILNLSVSSICLYSAIGIIIVALNLKFAQTLIWKYTNWLNSKH